MSANAFYGPTLEIHYFNYIAAIRFGAPAKQFVTLITESELGGYEWGLEVALKCRGKRVVVGSGGGKRWWGAVSVMEKIPVCKNYNIIQFK